MDCCGFRVSDLGMETILSLTVGVILSLVAYYWVHRRNYFKHGPKPSSTCSSPNCVRCNERVIERIVQTAVEQFDGNQSTFEATERLRQGILNRDNLTDELSQTNSLQQPNVLFIPELGTGPSLQCNVYKNDTECLEEHYDEFLNEFKSVYHSPEGWSVNSVPTGQWSVFYLINQGNYIAENCKRCPKTTAFIYRLKNLMTDCLFGNVGFSILDPGTYISEHFGPTNARIRCHLGLVVPDSCELSVGNLTIRWSEGKCILFDDSFLHSAYHGGTRSAVSRAVLLVDLWHPSLTASERELLKKCYPSVCTDPKDCVTD